MTYARKHLITLSCLTYTKNPVCRIKNKIGINTKTIRKEQDSLRFKNWYNKSVILYFLKIVLIIFLNILFLLCYEYKVNFKLFSIEAR